MNEPSQLRPAAIDRVTVGNLRVAKVLHDFVTNEALAGTGLDPESFWAGVDKVVTDLTPKNQELLARRDDLQAQIDKWHRQRVIEPVRRRGLQAVPHRDRLPAARACRLHRHHVRRRRRDHHHRRAAAGGADPQRPLRAQRGQRAVGFAVRRAVRHRRDPRDRRRREGHQLQPGARRQGHRLRPGVPRRGRAAGVRHLRRCHRATRRRRSAVVALATGARAPRPTPAQFVGYLGDADAPTAVLLAHHGLHVEILVDPDSPVGSTDKAGRQGRRARVGVTTIMDFEDSVAAVDADDKVLGYRNWLGLNRGDLTEEVSKGGKTFTRVLNEDRTFTDARRTGELTLPGPQPAVRAQRRAPDDQRRDRSTTRTANEVPEGIQDALFTGLIAMHGLKADDEQRPAAQQPHRLDLHRQAEDARPRRGRVHLRAVQPRRGRARPAAGHHQGRHHGRGTPHHGQPQGVHQGRRRPGGVHQHRLPRPHRRRDPHLDGGRTDGPQGRR